VINDWLKQFVDDETKEIAAMCCKGNDFQNANYVNINHKKYLKGVGNAKGITKFNITKNNIMQSCIYYSVRHVITPQWYNDRDQFLFPDSAWEKDKEFQNDCLIFTLFNNNIQSKHGINHWIPFTAEEVDAKDNLKSNFMSEYIKGKKFSKEAKAVLKSGKELWKYYHSKISGHRNAPTDASFYDIREFFQGRSESGTMKQKSTDETYNSLIKTLRQNLSVLAEKIKPKVYEYGFLVE
jgi:hypothetical protein